MRVASDQTSVDSEAFCKAVRTWAAQHRGVTALDLMNAVDTAPDADATRATPCCNTDGNIWQRRTKNRLETRRDA